MTKPWRLHGSNMAQLAINYMNVYHKEKEYTPYMLHSNNTINTHVLKVSEYAAVIQNYLCLYPDSLPMSVQPFDVLDVEV